MYQTLAWSCINNLKVKENFLDVFISFKMDINTLKIFEIKACFNPTPRKLLNCE
jgi:hypothetical protein